MNIPVNALTSAPVLHGVLRHWSAEPLELALIIAPAIWYTIGVRSLWRAAGVGRGVSRLQTAAFAAGIFALFIALASPLDALAEALFSAHMVQHLLLILVAAPLCVLGAPTLPLLWALPKMTRRRVGAWWRRHSVVRHVAYAVTAPGVVFTLHTVAIWYWHFPVPYELALRNQLVHALEHLSFFGTALLFWWVVVQPLGRRRIGYAMGLLLIGGTLMQSGALGALLMLARAPWYPAHAIGAHTWGLTPLADQQLAGLIMWVPAGLIYIGAAALLFMKWMRSDEQRVDTVTSARSTRGLVASDSQHRGSRVLVLLVIVASASVSACKRGSSDTVDRYVEGGNARRGRATIAAYGCGSCHSIPGVPGANGMVGPPLDHWSKRRIIAGVVPNDPARLITWLTVPQSIQPGNAMPNMGVNDGEARDMAAYLYSLR